MDLTQGFALAALTTLGVILVIVTAMRWVAPRRKRPTPLAGIAFACVIAGVVFDRDRRLGYALLGAGILMAALDAVIRTRRHT